MFLNNLLSYTTTFMLRCFSIKKVSSTSENVSSPYLFSGSALEKFVNLTLSFR